jgi:hypothetical protein
MTVHGRTIGSSPDADEHRLEVRFNSRASAALRELASELGVSLSEAVSRAIGLELYLLKYAGTAKSVIVENKRKIRTEVVLRDGRNN